MLFWLNKIYKSSFITCSNKQIPVTLCNKLYVTCGNKRLLHKVTIDCFRR